MPSTRKQNVKEKRSRQSDVMSDIENMDVMSGTYSRNHSDEELDVIRSLLNTENRSENGVTIDTTRLISTEISQQVTRKLDELKIDLNTQNTESIN